MAIDTTPSKVASDALSAIPFGNIIGGPLTACIDAQALAAQTTWQFIQNVGLNTDPKTGEKKAVTVAFQFMRDGKMAQLNVPLLTIVPIPYIAIQTIDISFKANISASSSSSSMESQSEDVSAGINGSASLNLGLFKVNAGFNASYSSKKDSKATQDSQYSVEYTMDVAVHAGQDGMPAGLAKVLEILGNSLNVSDPGGALDVSSQLLKGEKGHPEQLIATFKNSEGKFEPEKIVVIGGSTPLQGSVQGNSAVFELPVNEKETVYIVSVKGADKTVKVRTVDTISADKERETARLQREQERRLRLDQMEKDLAAQRQAAEAAEEKRAAERAAQLQAAEEQTRKDDKAKQAADGQQPGGN